MKNHKAVGSQYYHIYLDIVAGEKGNVVVMEYKGTYRPPRCVKQKQVWRRWVWRSREIDYHLVA